MYSPIMLVDCSGCHTPLQPPPGALVILCGLCRVVTHVIAGPHYSVVAPQLPSSAPHCYWNAPSPWLGAPPGPLPNVHGRKKAVIVGITYRNSRHELEGCINDAKCMRELLTSRYQFPDASILMLTEEGTDPYRIPTRHNMMKAMSWLVQGCQSGDSLVFYYSGHGSQLQTYNSDEADGYDETLCPLDYETRGMIVDDEINALLVRPLPHGVRLHALIDASHSGTVLDLPFLCRMNRKGNEYEWEDHRPRSGAWKGSNGEVISFSSCHDHQTSAQTSARSSEIPTNGAMTFCFILAIESGYGGNYGSILNSMRTNIRKVVPNGGSAAGSDALAGVALAASVTCSLLTGDVVTPLISMLLLGRRLLGRGAKIQEPQLAASVSFDVYQSPFYL